MFINEKRNYYYDFLKNFSQINICEGRECAKFSIYYVHQQ